VDEHAEFWKRMKEERATEEAEIDGNGGGGGGGGLTNSLLGAEGGSSGSSEGGGDKHPSAQNNGHNGGGGSVDCPWSLDGGARGVDVAAYLLAREGPAMRAWRRALRRRTAHVDLDRT